MEGRNRSNLVKEITLILYSASSSLEPWFAIFIDLCSCVFQAVESFTAQVNQLIDA